MSGHSHAKTVLRRKTSEDQKRGKVFSKIARVISVAAKEGGDPETNSKLRQALDEAKRFNLPKENIERAIKKGMGELESERLEKVLYEGFGPGGTALIIEGITDNKNRTLSEVKQILQKHNGKLAAQGSIKWLFEQKGVITLRIIRPVRNQGFSNGAGEYEYTNKDKEDLELKAIEAGAEDIRWYKEDGEFLDLITKPDELDKVKKSLEAQGIKIESATLDWVSKEEIDVSEKDRTTLEKLFEDLDENDAIQDIYSNLKI